jgi:hypothetical protein
MPSSCSQSSSANRHSPPIPCHVTTNVGYFSGGGFQGTFPEINHDFHLSAPSKARAASDDRTPHSCLSKVTSPHPLKTRFWSCAKPNNYLRDVIILRHSADLTKLAQENRRSDHQYCPHLPCPGRPDRTTIYVPLNCSFRDFALPPCSSHSRRSLCESS